MAEGLPQALLSVWAGPEDVYAVGADGGDGPLIMRLHEGRWETLHSGAQGHLWWLDQAPDGQLWMVGAAGLVLRFDPATAEFTRIDVSTDKTLFGIHFTDAGGGWIVGGDASPEQAQGGILLRLQDGEFLPDERLDASVIDERSLFKVWAQDDSDAWFVGEGGLVLHFDGEDYVELPSGTRERLLTVRGAAGVGPWMVGGLNNAMLMEVAAGELADRSLELDEGFAPALNGVALSMNGNATVVGNRGFIAQRPRTGPWQLVDQVTQAHLHAVAVGESEEAWAVGGNILSEALDEGVLLHRGLQPVAEP